MLSREWRCSWSSADRLCSNYIWAVNNFIVYQGAAYIRHLTVNNICILLVYMNNHLLCEMKIKIFDAFRDICYAISILTVGSLNGVTMVKKCWITCSAELWSFCCCCYKSKKKHLNKQFKESLNKAKLVNEVRSFIHWITWFECMCHLKKVNGLLTLCISMIWNANGQFARLRTTIHPQQFPFWWLG